MEQSTRCPVSADWIAICAVSTSRTSPTRMMSGSWRRIALSPLAKVVPASRLICTWLMFPKRYSTGSSMVVMFRPALSSSLRAA